jgi:hypothetical protein
MFYYGVFVTRCDPSKKPNKKSGYACFLFCICIKIATITPPMITIAPISRIRITKTTFKTLFKNKYKWCSKLSFASFCNLMAFLSYLSPR